MADGGSRWTRREVLILGGAGVAAAAGGVWLWAGLREGAPPSPVATPGSPSSPGSSASGGGTLREPEVLRSVDGRLDVELTAALVETEVAGRIVRALSYRDRIPGPTLRVRAGDRITLRLRNGLDAPTNLHTHGLVVSPEGNSDNVFVMLDPGEAFDYDYRLGPDHPPGVFWYHPHHHGTTAEQLFGGLFGAIVVEEPEPVAATRERLLIVSDTGFDAAGNLHVATQAERMLGREGELVLVNGQLGASIEAAPGDREHWRLVNACSSRHLRLQLDGQRMSLLGIDAGRYAEPREVEEVVLAPGNRAELIVTAVEGESVLRTMPFDRGAMGMAGSPPSATTGADLVSVVVRGEPEATAQPTPPATTSAPPEPRDLRGGPVDVRRIVTLAMGMGGGMGGGPAFTIDGREFDEGRVDLAVRHGAIEEWTIVNTSPMDHPFHLHVWPMQLVEVDGEAADVVDHRDVVHVRARSTTVVRIAFEGIAGRTVFHCHILDHEDQGMMAVVEAT
ncbi:multicopper oxidase family protein [Agromyces aurantiacus]|uniref:Multicopper oxidase family protein n=1 Tax=Agromyces aurantiacus TaxID=165814 RepID=A0ABV9R2S3_9MICO|nr:multicopper oxidase family protein [Agromyces aurantiacus]MBM7502808.1 FtsP/CotA-like multicopper oxidase with cupredoxin domain [Agromyces aurantiacus]